MRIRWFVPWVLGAAATCAPSLEEIRSLATSGDVQRAVSLSADRVPAFREVGIGTLDRLARRDDARETVIAAMDQVPATALPLLDRWAEDGSDVTDVVRTFARARVSELENGSWEDELTAALASVDPAERAAALRGLIPVGVALPRLIEALDDDSPGVAIVAARELADRLRSGGAIVADYGNAIRERAASHARPAVRAALLGALDPNAEADRALLVAALADDGPGIRAAAARTVGRLQDPRSIPEAAALLDGPPSAEALVMATEAGRMGNTELAAAYRDRVFAELVPGSPLRIGVLLGTATDDAGIAFLRRALDGASPAETIAACSRLTEAGEETVKCVRMLREIATGTSDPATGADAAGLLVDLGDPAAPAWLRSFFASGDAALRSMVMQTIAARRFDPELLGLGLTDPEVTVAAAAAVAALRVPE